MATRRRRTTTPRPVSVETEPTHEEMLEVAEEREVEAAAEEEAAIEAILSAALADVFDTVYSEEEEEEEPAPQVVAPLIPPAQEFPIDLPVAERKKRRPRYTPKPANPRAHYRRDA